MTVQSLNFLQHHTEVALATCEGNLPYLRQFQIMRQEGTTLYFATSPEKEVYRQLLANPNVALMAAADGVTVCCSGTVRFDVDVETCRWIYDNNPVLPRLYSAWNKLVYFRLPIAKIDYYDLRPTPPISQHIDIATGTATNGFVGERFES